MTLYARLQSGSFLRIFCTKNITYFALGCGPDTCASFQEAMKSPETRKEAMFRILQGLIDGTPELRTSKVPQLEKTVSFVLDCADKVYFPFEEGRVALIVGDAAQSTSFFSGSGANYGLCAIGSVIKYLSNRKSEDFTKNFRDVHDQMKASANGFVPYLDISNEKTD